MVNLLLRVQQSLHTLRVVFQLTFKVTNVPAPPQEVVYLVPIASQGLALFLELI